jgi:hypothetical protein
MPGIWPEFSTVVEKKWGNRELVVLTKSVIRVSQPIYETQKYVFSIALESKAGNQQTDSCGWLIVKISVE